MSKTKFEGWFPSRYNCFAISNTDSDDAFAVSEESFFNPPINVLFPDCSDNDLGRFCDATENPDNPPEFAENLVPILRGASAIWRLTGVDIDVIGGISLCYASNSPAIQSSAAGTYSTGYVNVSAFDLYLLQLPMVLKFEKACISTTYTENYTINAEVGNYKTKMDTLNIQIAKFTGTRKLYDLEMREDNHGLEPDGDKQYYTGILYL